MEIKPYKNWLALSFYLFGVLRRFPHSIGHITTGSWKDRGNQYIQLVKVLYCKLPTNSKQLPAFPLEVRPGSKPQSQRSEARVLPLCHHGPWLALGKQAVILQSLPSSTSSFCCNNICTSLKSTPACPSFFTSGPSTSVGAYVYS